MDTLNQLLSLNLEIEGLLRVLIARPQTQEALQLLTEKNEAFQDLLSSLSLEAPADEEPQKEEITNAPEKPQETFESAKPTVADNMSVLPEFKVEDMIAQREAGDLSRAFSINDKYRFIRDLFNNNKEKFNDTIARVVSMNSLTQAYEYFLDELGWDADDPAVSDFLSIIAHHFNSVQ